jgi:hypothetical protein
VNRPPGRAERIAQLERRVADLRARLPKHSVPPAMLIELEDLELELEGLRAEAARDAPEERAA